jgi:hypothetical protein
VKELSDVRRPVRFANYHSGVWGFFERDQKSTVGESTSLSLNHRANAAINPKCAFSRAIRLNGLFGGAPPTSSSRVHAPRSANSHAKS